MNVQDKIKVTIDNNLEKFSKCFPSFDINRLSNIISIDIRNMGTTGGRAHLQTCLIEINSQMVENYPYEDVEKIVIHELAHIITYFMFGVEEGKAHGKQWKRVMELLDQTADRCHSFALTPKRICKKFLYKCDCGDHLITSIRHNRSLKGTKYFCNTCSGLLTFVKPC